MSCPAARPAHTALLAERTAQDLLAMGHRVRLLALRDLPAAPLLAGDTRDPTLAHAACLVDEADALVVATPIYQAAYSGLNGSERTSRVSPGFPVRQPEHRVGDERYTALDTELVVEVLAGSGRHGMLTVVRIR